MSRRPLDSRRLFHRIEVLALDILYERHGEGGVVRYFAHQRGDLFETGHLRGAPAPLAGNQLVTVAIDRPHQYRLHQALRPDGGGELGERLLVHPGSRLIAARTNAAARSR